MKLRFNSIVQAALFALVLSALGQHSFAETPTSDDAVATRRAERLFTLNVLPLLKEKCYGCHGNDADDVKGEFDVRSREALLMGGESEEPSIVPGNPEESPFYMAVIGDGLEMPPKENDRLTDEQTEFVRRWIAAGAPWPDEATQDRIRKREWSIIQNEDGVIVPTSGGTADEWTYRRYKPEDIWAFKPVEKIEVGRLQAEGQHPVDFFVQQRLEEAEIKAAQQADVRTLIRRATYDLTGLPPTPQEIFQFRQAWEKDSEKAWSELITRLLDSKHYGERWAQHWLDVVRYADTAGFSNDYERSNAWRYRDYVIRSFNNDKPFNDFIVEQIAGDESRPEDPEAIVATGMLRMGPWGTAMVPQDEARQIYLDDLVHNVGQAFLSMPMRCCKCHDHKFDPIPTRDYYRMYAAFATTQPAEVDAAFLPQENRNGFAAKRKLVEELLAFAKGERDKIQEKQEAAAKKWYEEHDLPYKNENARKKDPEDKKPPRHVGLSPEEKGMKKVREQDVWIWERRLERYEPLAQAVYNGQDDYKNGRKLRIAKKIKQNWRPETFILAGGSLAAKQDTVGPGVLSGTALPFAKDAQDPFVLPDDLSGRRLALANWIANDGNPLTARSIVNRIWQYHFGQGIVRTANNFGAKGSKPTHPHLLDWLTADFIENGWKIKRLHQLIMSSDAYRRSGKHPNIKQLDTSDPNNELLARFPVRRLTAEELRDSALLISGELHRETGGVPIMPEINMEVALQPRMIQFSIAPAHQPSRTPAERNRRTIYAYRVRGQADPLLEIMNLPNPNESCEARDSAAVTPQAFTLLNSDVMTDRSIAFALRVQRERKGDVKAQIRRAVQLAYGRVPTAKEQESLEGYLSEMLKYHQEIKPASVEYPKEVTRSLVEEFTGEPFEFIEKLNVYNDYVSDAKPWTVDAKTRALADVCLLLINSNEFMYVY
ncbi:MAG: PSD1 domain-containing protein [Planctomycetes bacterium]|nr:PSD1 domain-containing protein [Planctomycetota bacterium]